MSEQKLYIIYSEHNGCIGDIYLDTPNKAKAYSAFRSMVRRSYHANKIHLKCIDIGDQPDYVMPDAADEMIRILDKNVSRILNRLCHYSIRTRSCATNNGVTFSINYDKPDSIEEKVRKKK